MWIPPDLAGGSTSQFSLVCLPQALQALCSLISKQPLQNCITRQQHMHLRLHASLHAHDWCWTILHDIYDLQTQKGPFEGGHRFAEPVPEPAIAYKYACRESPASVCAVEHSQRNSTPDCMLCAPLQIVGAQALTDICST